MEKSDVSRVLDLASELIEAIRKEKRVAVFASEALRDRMQNEAGDWLKFQLNRLKDAQEGGIDSIDVDGEDLEQLKKAIYPPSSLPRGAIMYED